MKYLKGLVLIIVIFSNGVNAEKIYDEARERSIPVAITFPVVTDRCSLKLKCSVAFLSAGYGISHSKYTFLSCNLVNIICGISVWNNYIFIFHTNMPEKWAKIEK